MDPLSTAIKVAASGLTAQSTRMRIVSENLANAQSTSNIAGGDPYRRKTVSFSAELDRSTGGTMVDIASISRDPTDFEIEYRPGDKAADAFGYVKLPNVNVLVEMADMREANRGYEANLQVVRQARDLISMTIGLLRNGQ